ncbi:transposase [Micromonospora sp. Mcm103]|uniref:transposase n=1 Tax=Micromonospora sp. Mcm103 TaxID=2926015 RepID=UPI003966B226
MLVDQIVRWRPGLDDLLARFAYRLGRAQPRKQALSYLAGLLSPLAVKNGWTLAEAAGDTTPDRMQRLLSRSLWDPDAVRDDLFAYVREHLSHNDGVLIDPDRRSVSLTPGEGQQPPPACRTAAISCPSWTSWAPTGSPSQRQT